MLCLFACLFWFICSCSISTYNNSMISVLHITNYLINNEKSCAARWNPYISITTNNNIAKRPHCSTKIIIFYLLFLFVFILFTIYFQQSKMFKYPLWHGCVCVWANEYQHPQLHTCLIRMEIRNDLKNNISTCVFYCQMRMRFVFTSIFFRISTRTHTHTLTHKWIGLSLALNSTNQ